MKDAETTIKKDWVFKGLETVPVIVIRSPRPHSEWDKRIFIWSLFIFILSKTRVWSFSHTSFEGAVYSFHQKKKPHIISYIRYWNKIWPKEKCYGVYDISWWRQKPWRNIWKKISNPCCNILQTSSLSSSQVEYAQWGSWISLECPWRDVQCLKLRGTLWLHWRPPCCKHFPCKYHILPQWITDKYRRVKLWGLAG